MMRRVAQAAPPLPLTPGPSLLEGERGAGCRCEMTFSIDDHLARFGPDSNYATVSPEEAAAYCRRLTREHYENFSVAHRLLARELVPHFCSIYAYCRWSDDLADEVTDSQRSLQLLDWWQDLLERCFAGEARHPVFVALASTIRQHRFSAEPFRDLLSAFRQDQHVNRYADIEQLLDYCRRSANPVGRMVLRLADADTPENVALSDSICTGLQWANFCQDVARDAHNGRIYLPQTTLASHDCREDDLLQASASERLREALREEVSRAEGMLREGAPLAGRVPRCIRKEVYLFCHGGLEILNAIRRSRYDVLSRRPTVGRWTKLRLLWQACKSM